MDNKFKKGTVEKVIFDYWNEKLKKTSDFEFALMELDKQELVYFIMNCQCKGKFGNKFIHP